MKRIFLYLNLSTAVFATFSFDSPAMCTSLTQKNIPANIEIIKKASQNLQKERVNPSDVARIYPLSFERNDDNANLLKTIEKNELQYCTRTSKYEETIPISFTITKYVTVTAVNYAVIDPDWKIFIANIFRIG